MSAEYPFVMYYSCATMHHKHQMMHIAFMCGMCKQQHSPLPAMLDWYTGTVLGLSAPEDTRCSAPT